MKHLILCLFGFASLSLHAQVMTFDTGATEAGFTFDGFNSAPGTIWVADLASTATLTKDARLWNFVSFKVGPFLGENMIMVESNLGDSFTYDGNIPATHTLNWSGIQSITFSRISGSGFSNDLDDFVYDTVACVQPTTPIINVAVGPYCVGDSVTLDISGTLNSADAWYIYSDSCGGALLGSTLASFTTLPTTPSATYYVRGEDGLGCVDEESVGCMDYTVAVTTLDNSVIDASPVLTAVEVGGALGATYQWLDCNNGNAPIPGQTSQSFVTTENGSYAVEISLNGCSVVSDCITVSSNSIGTNSANVLNIYPNPNNGKFRILFDGDLSDTRLSVFDQFGHLVSEQMMSSGPMEQINLPDLESGVYLLVLDNGKDQYRTHILRTN